jgi:hypothetical protein
MMVSVREVGKNLSVAFSDCQYKRCMTKQPCHKLRCTRRRRVSDYGDVVDLGIPDGNGTPNLRSMQW